MDKDIEFVVELWMAIQKRREDSMKDCPQELAGYSPEKQEATQEANPSRAASLQIGPAYHQAVALINLMNQTERREIYFMLRQRNDFFTISQ